MKLPGIWPGWLLLAGAGGWAAGYGIDSIRRGNQIAGTNQSIAGAGARNVGGETGGPFGGTNSCRQSPNPGQSRSPSPNPNPEPTPPPEPNPNREQIDELNRERGEECKHESSKFKTESVN